MEAKLQARKNRPITQLDFLLFSSSLDYIPVKNAQTYARFPFGYAAINFRKENNIPLTEDFVRAVLPPEALKKK